LKEIENHIAICYFYRDGDEKNKCELTDQRLFVRKRKLLRDFPLETVKGIAINQRKLLIPIIFSGIFTPLIVVGFFQGYFHPVIAVLFIITGIFTFYFGWIGQQVMTVNHMGGHTDFNMEYATQNILAFIEFANQYIQNETPELRSLYALIDKKDDQSLEALKLNVLKSKPDLYSYSQLKELLVDQSGSVDFIIMAIDPLKAGTEIKYELSKNEHTLKPVIKGNINRDAILGYYTLDEFLNFSFE